jgi:hypothetical protein
MDLLMPNVTMRPDTAPVGSRLLLRFKNQAQIEVEIVEWAKNGRTVRVSNMKGESYWRSDFDSWTVVGYLPPSVYARPESLAACPHPDAAVKADILEGDSHVQVQWCEVCGAFRFHWPYERMNGAGEPLPQYSDWRVPHPHWYDHSEKEVDDQC